VNQFLGQEGALGNTRTRRDKGWKEKRIARNCRMVKTGNDHYQKDGKTIVGGLGGWGGLWGGGGGGVGGRDVYQHH